MAAPSRGNLFHTQPPRPGAPVQRTERGLGRGLEAVADSFELNSLSTMVQAERSQLASSLQQPYSSRRLRQYVQKSVLSM